MRTYLLLVAAVALTVALVLVAARPAGHDAPPTQVTPLTAAPAVAWTGGN